MQNKWIDSRNYLLHFVSRKHGHVTNASLDSGHLVVTEVDGNLLRKFKTDEEKTAHMAKIKCWQNE